MSGMKRVAIIGCGDMGNKHAKAWQARNDAEIVAVCDIDPDRCRRMAENCSARGYDAWIDAVRHDGVEIVSICTPAKFHREIAVAGASAGRHVLCEKPMALTLDEANEMIAAANANGVQLSVCHQYRGASPYKALKVLVQNDELGAPLYVRFTEMREVRPKLAMHNRGLSGGPIHDMSGHLFDLMRFLTDSEPESVAATGSVFGKGKKRLSSIADFGIDTAEIQARFKGGHCLSIGICWGLPEGTPGHSNETIVGPKGMAFIEDAANRDRSLGARSDTTRVVVKSGGGTHAIECRAGPEGPDICISHLLAAIEGGASSPFDGREGREALRLILASLTSMETGQTVRLSS